MYLPEIEQPKSDELKDVVLPAADDIMAGFAEQKLLGQFIEADKIYRSFADFLGGQKMNGRLLTFFLFVTLDRQKSQPTYDPAATKFILAHFDEFISGMVPDPEVARDARRTMHYLQQVTLRKWFNPSPSHN